MIYKGDILISQDDNDNYDINFVNGQPEMTNAFETAVLLAVFGDRFTWQNDITENDNEKYISTFPELIARNIVSDKTKNDGIQSLKNAVEFMKKITAAQTITVTGKIISVYGIGWLIEFTKPNDESVKYYINWEKGIIQINGGI